MSRKKGNYVNLKIVYLLYTGKLEESDIKVRSNTSMRELRIAVTRIATFEKMVGPIRKQCHDGSTVMDEYAEKITIMTPEMRGHQIQWGSIFSLIHNGMNLDRDATPTGLGMVNGDRIGVVWYDYIMDPYS